MFKIINKGVVSRYVYQFPHDFSFFRESVISITHYSIIEVLTVHIREAGQMEMEFAIIRC